MVEKKKDRDARADSEEVYFGVKDERETWRSWKGP